MRLIDIHAHVNFNAFKDDSDEVMRRTLGSGVGMILVGSQIDTSRRAVEFANRYKESVWAAVGLHPTHLVETYHDHSEIGAPEGVSGFASRKEEFDYDAYYKIGADRKTVAIGECGLDYFRVESNEEVKKLQQETFRSQVRLARDLKKPLIVHCRPSGLTYGKQPPGTSLTDAYDDVLQIFKEEKADEIGGDIHFFVGNWEIAKKFLDFGFYLSFTGVITFAHQYDEVVKNIPLDRIMVETDAPYVAPAPYRGKRNEPLYVEEVAKKVAELKDLPFEEVAEATTKNAQQLFKL
jgi:TatD DNase family protein